MDTLLSDITQWFAILATGGTAIFALGKREKRLEDAEALARNAHTMSVSSAQSIAALEAKLTLMLDMLARIQRILDKTDA